MFMGIFIQTKRESNWIGKHIDRAQCQNNAISYKTRATDSQFTVF